MKDEKEKKVVSCDEFALPRYRYMELRYFCLQYSYWKYVHSQIEAGTWDMTREIARHPGNYYKDPTCAETIFKRSLEEKIALVDEAIDKVKTLKSEKKPWLLQSVTTEVSWEALTGKFELDGVDQDEFYRARMEFYHNLDMIQ